MLATALEKDERAGAEASSANLRRRSPMAAPPCPTISTTRMEALAVKHTGYRMPFVTGWGSTETAPTATDGALGVASASA